MIIGGAVIVYHAIKGDKTNSGNSGINWDKVIDYVGSGPGTSGVPFSPNLPGATQVSDINARYAKKPAAQSQQQGQAKAPAKASKPAAQSSPKGSGKGNSKDKDTEKTNVVYGKPYKDGRKGEYTGRTAGDKSKTPEKILAERDAKHHKNDEHGPAEIRHVTDSKKAARGLEQKGIDDNGGAQSTGGTSPNKINSIGTDNPKAKDYMKAANEYLKNKNKQQ